MESGKGGSWIDKIKWSQPDLMLKLPGGTPQKNPTMCNVQDQVWWCLSVITATPEVR
jgi:hypothetical protein